MDEILETAITGSFKFKPEIDALHEKFADYSVHVLEPTKGWLYMATSLPTRAESFRPLPSELGMTHYEVEKRFLAAVKKSDFLYVYNQEQYLGLSAMFEIAYALSLSKPILAKEAITLENVEFDLGHFSLLTEIVVVATPKEAARQIREGIYKPYEIL